MSSSLRPSTWPCMRCTAAGESERARDSASDRACLGRLLEPIAGGTGTRSVQKSPQR